MEDIEWDVISEFLLCFKKDYPEMKFDIFYNPHGSYITFSYVANDVYSSGSFPADNTSFILYRLGMILFRCLKLSYGEGVFVWENGRE